MDDHTPWYVYAIVVVMLIAGLYIAGGNIFQL